MSDIQDKLPLVIALCGFPGSGKDTLGYLLKREFKYETRAFADPLKQMLLEVDPLYKGSLARLERCKRLDLHYTREKLQNLGMAIRAIDPDHFARKAHEGIGTKDRVVFTDARFSNEVRGSDFLVNVVRPGHGPVNGHISEKNTQDLADIAHMRVVNDGTPEELLESFIATFISLANGLGFTE